MTIPLSNFISATLNVCLIIGRAALPQHCVLCGAHSEASTICGNCRQDLPWLPAHRCPQCALPTAEGRLCGACLDRPPRFARVAAAFSYGFPVDALVRRFKYAGDLALTRLLAQSIVAARREPVDAIVPMPLAPTRLAERGFNQALELARVVSARTGVALFPQACRRWLDTPPLAALPWDERAKHVRGAFACDMDLTGKTVAVVDDVLTTGATLNELARCLRRSGATAVHGWVVARTLPR